MTSSSIHTAADQSSASPDHEATKNTNHDSKTRARKKRQKTFTGCWTCRKRRVKCDEQRPACQRCVAGKFTCHGYGIRLTWFPQPNEKRRSKRPRRPSSQGANVPYLPSNNHGTINDPHIPSSSARLSPLTDLVSPGAGLSLNRLDGNLVPQSTDMISSVTLPNEYHLAFDDPVNGWSNFDEQLIQGDIAPPVSKSLTHNPDSSFEDSAKTWFNEDAEMGWVSAGVNDSSQSSTSVFGWQNGPTGRIQTFAHQREFARDFLRDPTVRINQPYANILPSSDKQRKLIHHWVSHLCEKAMPIRNASNPYLSVVSPIALEGYRISRQKTSSTVALFHAVCAASATHLINIQGHSSEMQDSALYHSSLSHSHLMVNIHSADLNERIASLGTICVLLLKDFIGGTPGTWRGFVKKARNIFSGIPPEFWNESTSASLTYQCYAIFFNLIQSQYIGHLEYPGPIATNLAGQDVITKQAVPKQSLDLISSFNARILRGDLIGPSEIDHLEIEFMLSTPHLSQESNVLAKDEEAVYHQRLLFYQASLLYFKCNCGRRDTEVDIQALVEKCMEHIEILDAIQTITSPRTWIYATVAFEAGTTSLRNRVRASFAHRRPLGFATWDKLLLASEEVWRVRDEALEALVPEHWSQIISRSPNLDVLWY